MKWLRGARTIPSAPWTAPSTWQPTASSFAVLIIGLTLLGVGDGLLVVANIGTTPWTVLAQGVAVHSPWDIGFASFVVSLGVLLFWFPLRQRPGVGTVTNVVVIAIALGATAALLKSPDLYAAKIAFVFAGIALMGLGSGLYLTTGLGPGPRDGAMTGIHHRTGWPVGIVRLGIEVTVVVIGWLLGGTVGLGTVLFALLIGQVVAIYLGFVARLRGAHT